MAIESQHQGVSVRQFLSLPSDPEISKDDHDGLAVDVGDGITEDDHGYTKEESKAVVRMLDIHILSFQGCKWEVTECNGWLGFKNTIFGTSLGRSEYSFATQDGIHEDATRPSYRIEAGALYHGMAEAFCIQRDVGVKYLGVPSEHAPKKLLVFRVNDTVTALHLQCKAQTRTAVEFLPLSRPGNEE